MKPKNNLLKQNKQPFDYSTSFKKENIKFIERKIKQPSFIVYNNLFLELIKKNRGLQKDVLRIIENKDLNIISRENYSIKRTTSFVTSKDETGKRRGNTLSNGFDIKVFNGKNIEKRFFLKEVSNRKFIEDYRGGVNEFFALKLLESNGINIIKPHFASHVFGKSEKTFIMLDFTNLITFDVAFTKKLVSEKENRVLKNKLDEISKKLKSKGYNIWDIEPHNIFVDVSKKPFKLYFSDPIFAILPEEYSSFASKINKF